MTDNNTKPGNNEQDPAEGYNQTPYDPEVTPPEPYRVPQRQQPPANPVQYQQYPPQQYPAMRPKTAEDFRQEQIRFNNLMIILIGTVGALLLFAGLGIGGPSLTAMGTAILTYRSVKLGGDYKMGLTFTFIHIALYHLFLLFMYALFKMSGMELIPFLEKLSGA